MSENPTTQAPAAIESPERRWLSPVLLGILVLIMCFLSFALFALFEPPSSRIVVDSFRLETTNQEEIIIPPLPVQLVIPRIGVNAVVQLVGLADDGTGEMGVPDNFTDVGWYKFGPRPGMPGSAVITGHLNGKNIPQAVFYDLSALEIDDLVEVIDEDGTTLTFQVVKMKTYHHDDSTEEVFVSTDGKTRLNLITCAGDWVQNEKLYDQRTVVFTELLSRSN